MPHKRTCFTHTHTQKKKQYIFSPKSYTVVLWELSEITLVVHPVVKENMRDMINDWLFNYFPILLTEILKSQKCNYQHCFEFIRIQCLHFIATFYIFVGMSIPIYISNITRLIYFMALISINHITPYVEKLSIHSVCFFS